MVLTRGATPPMADAPIHIDESSEAVTISPSAYCGVRRSEPAGDHALVKNGNDGAPPDTISTVTNECAAGALSGRRTVLL